jgi:ATP-binding cassette, subfamily C, bacterial CydCD
VFRQNSRLLTLARSEQFCLVTTILTGLSGGVFAILQAYLLSKVISAVFLEGYTLAGTKIYLAVLSLVILFRAISTWISEVSASILSFRIKRNLREKLLDHLYALGPFYTQGERSGELIHTTVEGIESLDNYFSQYLPQIFLSALIPLTILLVVFPLDVVSGLILLLTAPLIPLFMFLIGSTANSLTRMQWLALSRMSAYFLDTLQGLTTLKIFGRSREQIKVIAAVSNRYRETTMQVLRVAFLSALSLELIATISTAILAVGIGLRLLYSPPGGGLLGITFQGAFFILLLAPEFYLPLRLLGTRFHAGMEGVSAAGRIFEILAIPVPHRITGNDNQETTGLEWGWKPGEPSSIEFSKVSFIYPDRRPALKQVSFELAPGEVVGLVGPSGGGKSSLAQLLLRFIEPDEGTVRINGLPLNKITTQVWWRHVAWVSQNPYLFNDTVANNIALGKSGAEMEAVVEAAKKALAHDFILKLPEGYQTLVGERGSRLSRGEAQRIALARAFLKDASFVILDEPSSNLDPDTEASLFKGMQRLMQGRTVLVIAHRLATVKNCDRILVFEEGRLAESGTPSRLSQAEGAYQRLLQASLDFDTPGRIFAGSDTESTYLSPAPIERPDVISQPDSGSQHGDHLPVLLRLLSLLAPFKQQVILSVLLGFATIGSGIGLMATSAYIISAATLRPSIADLQIAIVGVRFFGISRGVFRYLERLVSHQVTFHVLSNLRVWFYKAIEPLAPARLLQFQSGDLFSRVTGDIATLESFYVRAAAPPLTALLVAFVAAILLLAFDLKLSLALLAFMASLGLGLPLLMRWLGRKPGKQLQRYRAELNMRMVDGIQGMADLLVYGQRERQEALARTAGQKLSGVQRDLAGLSALQSALISLFTHLGMVTVLILAIPMVNSGQIGGIYLAVIVLLALSSFEAIQPLPLAAQFLESNLEAGRRLFQLVDASPEVQNPDHPLPIPVNPTLKVEKLSFAYPASWVEKRRGAATRIGFRGGDSHILQVVEGLSFELLPGKRLAIVGPSGSGKSTIANLLLRFWEFAEHQPGGSGRISLAGHDLKAYDQQAVRDLFGVVSQNTYLFNTSVRENLLLASPTASEEQIIEATRIVEIHDFIQSLPEGYDTWIGEQGLKLSAGERQRIAIARAILKEAPILLLDEPTAHLDPLTEARVLASLHRLMEGRTTLMITHRLVGMPWMDEIIVLKAGRQVERGRHKDLIESGGLYCRMWELQNQLLIEAN